MSIEIRNLATIGQKSYIRDELEAMAAMCFETDKYQEVANHIVPTEPESFLRQLGIKNLSFTKKSEHCQVDCLFDGPDGSSQFYVAALIQLSGELITSPELNKEPTIKNILEIEILRLFCKFFDEVPEGCALKDIRIVLGLDEMYQPEQATIPKFDQTDLEFALAQAAAKASAQEKQVTDFFRENYYVFETFVNWLRNRIDIPSSFQDIQAATSELALKIDIDKKIPTVEGLTVEIKSGTHLLGPFVNYIDIFDPVQTREIIKNLKLDPARLPINLVGPEGEIDAYFVHVNLESEIGKQEQISACVIPNSSMFEVYVFGVDPQDIIDNQRKIPAALNHLILWVFKTAVDRIDDPSQIIVKVRRESAHRPGAQNVARAIQEATHTTYPGIVIEPKRDGHNIIQDEDGEVADDQDEKPVTISGKVKKLLTRILNDATASNEVTLEDILAIGSAFMQAGECFRILSSHPNFGQIIDIFPDAALQKGRSGEFSLKSEYAAIYVPIYDPSLIKVITDACKYTKMVELAQDSRASAWFEDIITGERRILAPGQVLDEIKIAAAFNHIFQNGVAMGLRVDPYYDHLIVQNVKPHSAFDVHSPYASLLCRVLETCRDAKKNPGLQDITIEEIFQAFLNMPGINPAGLKIPTAAASNYRLAYIFDEGGEVPEDLIFKDDDFEIAPEINLDVVAIVAGNRARFANLDERWLRGLERSHVMDVAAHVQRSYLNKTGEDINLNAQARALVVWELEENDGSTRYAFSYLATNSNIDTSTLKSITSANALQHFAYLPQVTTAIDSAKAENLSGEHTDFRDISHWNDSELIRLEKEGVFKLIRDGRGHIIGIDQDSVLKVKRKKIVIMLNEKRGYRQFRTSPADLEAYLQHVYQTEGPDFIDPDYNFDSRRSTIQQVIWNFICPKKKV